MTEVNTKIGTSWNNYGFFNTYEEAEAAKTRFLATHEKHDAKIRRRHSTENFLVKTRLKPEFQAKPEKKEKKSGKSKRRNKKNSEGRMFDSSASV